MELLYSILLAMPWLVLSEASLQAERDGKLEDPLSSESLKHLLNGGLSEDKRVFRYGKRLYNNEYEKRPAVFRYGKRSPVKMEEYVMDNEPLGLDYDTLAKRVFRYGKRMDGNGDLDEEQMKRLFRLGLLQDFHQSGKPLQNTTYDENLKERKKNLHQPFVIGEE